MTVTHRTWSTSHFVLSAPTLFNFQRSKRFMFRLNNHKHSIKHNLSGYPVAMHFNEQSHTMEDLRCIIIKNHVPNMVNGKLIEQRTIIKLNTHITGINKERFFIAL